MNIWYFIFQLTLYRVSRKNSRPASSWRIIGKFFSKYKKEVLWMSSSCMLGEARILSVGWRWLLQCGLIDSMSLAGEWIFSQRSIVFIIAFCERREELTIPRIPNTNMISFSFSFFAIPWIQRVYTTVDDAPLNEVNEGGNDGFYAELHGLCTYSHCIDVFSLKLNVSSCML